MSDGSPRTGPAPWWASGADEIDVDDPFTAHRRARADADDTAGRQDDDRPGEDGGWWQQDAHEEAVRSSLEDAIAILGALARAAAWRGGRGDGRTDGGPRGHDPTCRGCPLCVVTRSLGEARPEVTDHLEAAARHLVLAARAWVDAAEQRTATWEHIPLDDEEQQ